MSRHHRSEHELEVTSRQRVSALLLEPEEASCLLVLAHGAGAGMRYPPLERLAQRLAERGVATFRYQFPYIEQSRRRPDPPKILHRAVRAAVAEAHRLRPRLPLFAGGRSMGGRMTSQAQAIEPLPQVLGLVFAAFPLHPPKQPGTERAEHLALVDVPMLFLQGSRDRLARLDLLGPVCDSLGDLATLWVVDGADHSFAMLKSSGRTQEDVEEELADRVAQFARNTPAGTL